MGWVMVDSNPGSITFFLKLLSFYYYFDESDPTKDVHGQAAWTLNLVQLLNRSSLN